jgi:histidinol-phosphate/aromatic aminotransferase/cobyric acid decarboxylase-like protein
MNELYKAANKDKEENITVLKEIREELKQARSELKAINSRQAKESKFNFPFVAFGAVCGYSAIHISVNGVESYKALLIAAFDYTVGLFL